MNTYEPGSRQLLPSDPGYQEPGLESSSPELAMLGGLGPASLVKALRGLGTATISRPLAAKTNAQIVADALRGRTGYQWLSHGKPLAQETLGTLQGYPMSQIDDWAAQGLRGFPPELTNRGVNPQDLGAYLQQLGAFK